MNRLQKILAIILLQLLCVSIANGRYVPPVIKEVKIDPKTSEIIDKDIVCSIYEDKDGMTSIQIKIKKDSKIVAGSFHLTIKSKGKEVMEVGVKEAPIFNESHRFYFLEINKDYLKGSYIDFGLIPESSTARPAFKRLLLGKLKILEGGTMVLPNLEICL